MIGSCAGTTNSPGLSSHRPSDRGSAALGGAQLGVPAQHNFGEVVDAGVRRHDNGRLADRQLGWGPGGAGPATGCSPGGDVVQYLGCASASSSP